MASVHQGKRTVYRGVEYRSGLEAYYVQRMADGWPEWALDYEPLRFMSSDGAASYLPDFRRTSPAGVQTYIETKSETADLVDALDRMHPILDTEPDARLAVIVVEWGGGGYTGFSSGGACFPYDPCGQCHRKPPPAIGRAFTSGFHHVTPKDKVVVIGCPICECECVHITDTLWVDPLGAIIGCHCESGCIYSMIMRTHKGDLQITLGDIVIKSYDYPEGCASWEDTPLFPDSTTPREAARILLERDRQT